MTKLTKAEELEAARNLEPDDCDIMAVGNGRYTREMAERRAKFSAELAISTDDLVAQLSKKETP